jgi:hypothetical protein
MEGHRADPAQVRKATHHVFILFITYQFTNQLIYFSDLRRNVPGQALYLTSVQQVRNAIGRVMPSFALTKDAAGERLTTLVKLTATGNLVAGAVTRTAIGLVVNPLTVVKARYEVRERVPLLSKSWLSFDFCRSQNGLAGRGEGLCMLNTWSCRATITRTKASSRPCNRWYAKGRERSFKGSVRLRYEMLRTQGCTLCSMRGSRLG